MGGSSSKNIIVFVGPYGCGKSQFIDCLTQQTNWASDALQAKNHPVRSVKTKMRDDKRSVVLVDTPGFDDYTTNAEDILENVKHWLQNRYKNVKVTGILYLHNIQDNRLTRPPPIHILQDLCGDDSAKHLMFVTTHWDLVESALGERREAQIQNRLRPLLRAGARTDRFDMTTDSAWRILESLVFNQEARGPDWNARWRAERQLTSSVLPVSRPPAASTSAENNDSVPSTSPEPSSIVGPLHRLPAISTSEANDSVPSAAPEPSSIIVPVFRLRPSSAAEDDDFIPSAAPEPSSIIVPVFRLRPSSAAEDDDSVPSAAPEPSSIIVPVFRLRPSSTSAEDDDFVPSAPPQLGSITTPLYRLPATSTTVGGDDFVPSIVPEPSSITVPVDRLTATPTSAEDDDFVPATDPEPSSIVVPVFRSAASSTSPSDHFVSAART